MKTLNPGRLSMERNIRFETKILIVMIIAAFAAYAGSARGSDEDEFNKFIDNRLLLITDRCEIARGVGPSQETVPCRQYFRVLNIGECRKLPNLDISRDGRTLYAATQAGEIIAVDLRDGTTTNLARFGALGAIKLSNDGQSLGVATPNGVSILRLADRAVDRTIPWTNPACVSLPDSRLDWNTASNQLLVHGSELNFWRYDFATGASTEIKQYDDVFFHDGRAHGLRRTTSEERDPEIRAVATSTKGVYQPLIITRLNDRLKEEKLSNLMPSGCRSYDGFGIRPIDGSSFLMCRFGIPIDDLGLAPVQNLFIFDPSSRGFVPAGWMRDALPVCVEDNGETMRLIRQRVDEVLASGEGLRFQRITAKYNRHSENEKYPWNWSVDERGRVNLRDSIKPKDYSYRLDEEKLQTLLDAIKRIHFASLPETIGIYTPDTQSRTLEVYFDDGRSVCVTLHHLPALAASDAPAAGRFLELWTMIRGTFADDWAFDDRPEIEAWKQNARP